MTEVPGYEIGDVLGRGRFGVVHRARQLSGDREVAIRIDTRILLDADQRRFLREVKVVERLSAHPHVVEVHDAGVLADSRPYLVMELCQDGSLAGRAPLPPREVAELGQKLADALAAAHDLGVLHGAIGPEKILVKPYGTVGLTGFGLAALAAPAPTPQSDVHALAATLYTLLAGSPPNVPVEDVPEAPPRLMAVLRRGLAADPADRYQDAVALRADLSQLTVGDFSGPVISTAATTVRPSTSAPARLAGSPVPAGTPRRRTALLFAAVIAVVLVLAVWFLAFGR